MIKFDKNLLFYKLPPILYAVMIIAVSSISRLSPPALGVTWSDKIYHTGEYFVFGILIFRAFLALHNSPRKKFLYFLLFFLGLAYAALDERVQYYIPGRDSSPYDWMADALGYSLAGTLYILFTSYRKRKTGKSTVH